jgi:hypothetical protein
MIDTSCKANGMIMIDTSLRRLLVWGLTQVGLATGTITIDTSRIAANRNDDRYKSYNYRYVYDQYKYGSPTRMMIHTCPISYQYDYDWYKLDMDSRQPEPWLILVVKLLEWLWSIQVCVAYRYDDRYKSD